MNGAFQRRRDKVVAGLNQIDGVHCQLPKGAFYVFPNIKGVVEKIGALDAYNKLDESTRRNSSPSTLFQLFLLYRYHVATMDRRSFCTLDSEGHHYLRLSIATGTNDLLKAVERINEASNDITGFQDFVKSGVSLIL